MKPGRLAVIAVVVLSCCVAGVGAQQPAPAAAKPAAADRAVAARAAIEKANAAFSEAMKRGDAAGAASNYAADAIVMMPNVPAMRGTAAITAGMSAMVKDMTIVVFVPKTESVIIAGDLAVETGSVQMTMKPKAGPEMKDTGKYLTVWKHQADGSWKIIRDINNSDLPAGK
jgi:uncharacterized protein (TIGR02246 family)